MVNSQIEIDLVSHCIEYMSNKVDICNLFKSKGMKCSSSWTYKKLALLYEEKPMLFPWRKSGICSAINGSLAILTGTFVIWSPDC